MILLISFLKENVDFGSEDISDEPINNMEDIIQYLQGMENEIQDSTWILYLRFLYILQNI